MGKPQNGKKNGAQGMSPAKAIQQGQVKNNKQEKLKKSPVAKVQVVNGKSNGNAVDKKPAQSPAKKQQNTPSPKKNNNNNKNNKNQKKVPAPKPNKKNNKAVVKEEEDDDDSEVSDVDEGIPPIKEDISMDEEEDDTDTDTDSDNANESTPDIFGRSLAEDTDDDDDDFEEEKVVTKNGKKMGVKPFKGIKAEAEESDALDTTGGSSANSSMVTDEDDDEDDDDDEDEDDADDDDDEDDKDALEALMGDSIVDSENDEDFEHNGDDDDDDDDDEDVDEDEENCDLNQSATSIVEVKNGKTKLLTPEEKAEVDSRTIFIGNVPIAVDEKKIKVTFKTFGPIDSVRIRGVVPESPKVSKKVAAITKKFHPKATAKCAFVVFKTADSVEKALSLNGTKLDGNYLRVDKCNVDRQIDPKKAVFLGNLPFDLEDNELWEMFNKCGKIECVRSIRDRTSGCCRGMAYINFEKADSVALALDLNGQTIKNREIRVSPYKVTERKPKRSRSADSTGESPVKKTKREIAIATHNSVNADKRKNGNKNNNNNINNKNNVNINNNNNQNKNNNNKRSQGQKKRSMGAEGKPEDSPNVKKPKKTFQGNKADNKKPFKKGANKMEKQKKNLAGKLTAKPNKPVKNEKH